MKSEFGEVFERLRAILRKHADGWLVQEDSANQYSLAGSVGPATLRVWGGKLKRPLMPIAWVQIGKAYVSYHLMGVYGNARLLDGMSKELKARMQGKTCFNFKSCDDVLFKELDELTTRSIASFKKAGFASAPKAVKPRP
jgi:hypothetical protein